MKGFSRIKKWAKALKLQTLALYLAARHPGTPCYAKAMAGLVAAYALSPVDLIPDFIPVLGYLDDLIMLPLGIWLAVKMVPEEVWAECREKAESMERVKGPRWIIAVIIRLWGLPLLVSVLLILGKIN